ncbi:hypothetical protein FSARC_12318 [Fusarium sarcochroum]|uniref:monoamine oxidase n=1 Tax=Fusarium sarcochroum TaxID=1208366 RepID=A0A8H4T9S4_9HYPO|nr:hypothetical protein FSARC_12318 [Fusarium sarcochroum]
MTPVARSFQIVVLGAGPSGLRAAREVHKACLSYIVLEAMDRVGGKTLSVPTSSESKGIIDLGASWTNDTSQSEIYNWAREFGFDLVQKRTEGNNLYRDKNKDVHYIPVEMSAKASESEHFEQVEQFMHGLEDYADKCDIDNPSQGPNAKTFDSMTVKDFIGSFNHPLNQR